MPLMFQKGNVLVWLVVVLLIISFLGGGLYYYLEIYTPAQYAKAVISIYDEIKTQHLETNFQGTDDYEGLLAVLDEYSIIFSRMNDQLSQLKPSPIGSVPPFLTSAKRSIQIHEDFTKILEVFISNIGQAQEQAKKQSQFIVKAKELLLLLRPDLTEYPPKAVPEGQGVTLPPPPNTVGEYLAVWESRISKAKVVAEDLFSEPQDLGDVSFDELKSLWLETQQGYDALLPFLNKQEPKLTFYEVQKLTPEGDKAVFAKVDKIDEFLPMLESVLIRNNAENILKNSFISTPPDFNLRTSRLEAAIKDLKAKYKN
ncbi:MAG: hypothetical protein AAB414_03710 [Patescibacteria group bacterium]